MLEGEYSPIVYRAEKDGGKYEAAIWILKEAYGFSVHSAVVKTKTDRAGCTILTDRTGRLSRRK